MILGTLFGELSNPWTVSRAIPLRESCNLIRLSELVKSQRFVDSWYCDLNPCHSSGSPEKLINFLPYDCLASNFSIALSLLETCGSGTGSLLLTGGNRFGLLATTLLGEIGECCVTWTRSCNSVGSFRGSSWSGLPSVHYFTEQFTISLNCSVFITVSIMNNVLFIIHKLLQICYIITNLLYSFCFLLFFIM